MTGERGSLECGRQRPSARAGCEPPDQEPRVECVAGAGRVGRGDRLGRHLETQPRIALARQDRRALGAALHDGDPGEVQQAFDGVPAQESLRLGGRREQDVGRDLLDQGPRRASTAREQRTDRREIDAHGGIRATRELDPPAPRQAQRLVDERVQRQVKRVGAGEPGRLEIAWLELEGSPTVGDEGPLAVRRDQDADPPRASARDADHPRGHAVAADRLHERPARRVAPDRRDER